MATPTQDAAPHERPERHPLALTHLIHAVRPPLPPTWRIVRRDDSSLWWFHPRKRLRVCEMFEAFGADVWHHVVISHPTRNVRLDEVDLVRDQFFSDDREVLLVIEPPTLRRLDRIRLSSARLKSESLVPEILIVSGGAPAAPAESAP